MSGVNEIRSTFLDYFRKNGHEVVASSPLVPRNDPTLMFTNAGMVQFKNVFTGLEQRPYSRATTAQKSVRAGGKHNDLDNVGYTARHLTFFEMLGNFSFGDYFKERAIELAWNLITREFGLPKDKLLVTVYHTDDDAASLWKKIAGFSDDRIIRIPTSDNFWAMGDTGPCGPCSEIFIDRGEHIWGGPPGSPEEDGDRFLEFWNLVFMQYEQVTKEERVALPRPSIDTGMGLERMASILQGVDSVFETDLFRHLIDAASSALGHGPEARITSRRSASSPTICAPPAFLVADGVLPSNEGRGYVLRRIMRRAMRHAQLARRDRAADVEAGARAGARDGPGLSRTGARRGADHRDAEARGDAFPQDAGARPRPARRRDARRSSAGDMLDGETAFKLYDTYGFPLDLTQDALRQRDISVDLDGFTDAMERQKAEARKSWAGSGEAATETVWFAVREKAGATEFLGYETEAAEGIVLSLVKDGAVVDVRRRGRAVAVVVNQTPFYGEFGGQMGDTGTISGEGFSIDVTDTQKKADGLFVHYGKVAKGSVKTGAAVELKVDHARRTRLRSNHSATHLIHEALREVLGTHVAQKGSLVAPERLRFDISHNKPISAEELEQVERMANEIVVQNSPVTTRLMSRRRRHRRRRDGAVRREIRRRGARRVDGHRPAWRKGEPALFDRALRRHACARHRRHRPGAHRLRQRGRGRRAPHRGADRRGGEKTSRRAGPAAEGDGRDAQGFARRCARACRGVARRAQEARTRTVRCAQEAGAGRRRAGRRATGRRKTRPSPASASSASRSPALRRRT